MKTSGVERVRLTSAGSFLVGVDSSVAHHIAKLAGQGDEILRISNAGYGFTTAVFCSVGSTNLGSASEAALKVGTNPSTGRSLNAGGTINASGADYAEYMLKAAGCGIVAKGDVCGVDRNGHLTHLWADAISHVVKSTEPGYTAGDNWVKTPKPEQEDKESDADFTRRLADWKVIHEAERAVVDRIAFAGQVPCNVTGAFAVGDYIVAAQDGDGIKAIAVKAGTITLAQYMARIGKVWAIRDGRAWIDVQHG
ncbi:hypothetical protein P0F65_13430 [Sphingomonas sp. I4]